MNDDFTIPISVFEGKDDPQPTRHDMGWHALARRLSRYDERLTKDGRAWSPVTYHPGTTRGKANVDQVFALVLDIDHGELPLDLLEGYEYVAHTTFQHTPEAPRWRVVVPLVGPIPGADWPAFWLRANAFFGGCIDPATKDSSRISYLPSCPPGGVHETRQQHGRLLDPDELPEVPVYTPAPRRKGKPSVFKHGLAEWAQRFSIVKVAELASMPHGSGRNDACNRLAHLLGGLVAEPMHDLQPEWVVEQLLDACHQNGLIGEDGERSVRATIRSGLESGLMRGWSPADQDPPTPIGSRRKAVQSMPSTGLKVERMSEVTPEAINWLWRGRLARGKATLLMGDPGLGKSLISHWLSAQVSTGADWPDGGQCDRGSAILFTIEDGLADTVQPRLVAAGADTSRIVAVRGVLSDDDSPTERMFALDEHLALLEELVVREHATLVVMDPVSAYLGADVNAHKESDVRQVLGPLQLMAERHNIVLLLVIHLTKGSGVAALYRATGSIAFPAVCRVVLGVAPDPNDEEGKRRLLLPIKMNVGVTMAGIGYRIETTRQSILPRADARDQPPVLVWDDEPVLVDATIAMDRAGNASETTAVAAVKQTLTETFVSAGKLRLAANECLRALRDNNNSTSGSVIDRAKKDLGIRSEKDGPSGPWYWVVPANFLSRARIRNMESTDSLDSRNVALGSTNGTQPSVRTTSSPSQQSSESAESDNLSRAREPQEMQYCVHCMKNLTVDVYEAHQPCPEKVILKPQVVEELCPVHKLAFDKHDCDQL